MDITDTMKHQRENYMILFHSRLVAFCELEENDRAHFTVRTQYAILFNFLVVKGFGSFRVKLK